LDLVQADMEGTGYACGAVDTCAAGFGAPHIRQRLYWVAYADDARLEGRRRAEERATERAVGAGGMADRLADAIGIEEHEEQQRSSTDERRRSANELGRCGLVDARAATSPTNGFWRDVDWLFCRDGRWRPVEPGTFPLAHGAAARVGRLRGYGNAIVAPAAQAFIEAYLGTGMMPANDNHCGVTFRPAA